MAHLLSLCAHCSEWAWSFSARYGRMDSPTHIQENWVESGPGTMDSELFAQFTRSTRVTRGYKGVGLQPETMADRLLVEQSHPASKIASLDLKKH
eukprot:1153788-Pelagomonas_calceolata.AAC.2